MAASERKYHFSPGEVTEASPGKSCDLLTCTFHVIFPSGPSQQHFLTRLLTDQLSFAATSSFPEDVIFSEQYMQLDLRTEEQTTHVV